MSQRCCQHTESSCVRDSRAVTTSPSAGKVVPSSDASPRKAGHKSVWALTQPHPQEAHTWGRELHKPFCAALPCPGLEQLSHGALRMSARSCVVCGWLTDTGPSIGLEPGETFPHYPHLTEMQAQDTPKAHHTPPSRNSAPLTWPPTLSLSHMGQASQPDPPQCTANLFSSKSPVPLAISPVPTASGSTSLCTPPTPGSAQAHYWPEPSEGRTTCVHLCAPSPSPTWARTMLGAQTLFTCLGGQMQPQPHWPVLTAPFRSNRIKLPWQEGGRELTWGVLTA